MEIAAPKDKGEGSKISWTEGLEALSDVQTLEYLDVSYLPLVSKYGIKNGTHMSSSTNKMSCVFFFNLVHPLSFRSFTTFHHTVRFLNFSVIFW